MTRAGVWENDFGGREIAMVTQRRRFLCPSFSPQLPTPSRVWFWLEGF